MKKNLSITYIKYYSISKYVTAMQIAECNLMLRAEKWLICFECSAVPTWVSWRQV